MRVVFLGLSITSSWGNGHATNYRALCEALRTRGHEVLFLERDAPWYAAHRDYRPPFVRLYRSLDQLGRRYGEQVRAADLVIVGSFVPDGVAVGEWVLDGTRGVTAFWDIDTPVTAAKLDAGDHEYLTPELAGRYDLYLSFTGGPLLDRLRARRPRTFYCMVDGDAYRPIPAVRRYALGYLGTYSVDRQDVLDRLLLQPARRVATERFVVAGPQYPASMAWPPNVERIEHVPPGEHRRFYARQRLTLNLTRRAMVEAGWSPSVRLFEAAACAIPVITDRWPGLDEFFIPGEEIVVADTADEVVQILDEADEAELAAIGRRARARVLADHTAERRAEQLEGYVGELIGAAA
jgi:spore maturation protein CgeB